MGTVTATFEATRSELLGTDVLPGTAELARRVCRRAVRRVGIVSLDSTALRRIDGWVSPDGFVTHAAGPNSTDPSVGSVGSADGASELVAALTAQLAGGLPTSAAASGRDVDGIDRWSTSSLPADVTTAVVVSSAALAGDPSTARHVVLVDAGGLAAATVADLSAGATLAPLDPGCVAVLLRHVLASAPRTIAELLTD